MKCPKSHSLLKSFSSSGLLFSNHTLPTGALGILLRSDTLTAHKHLHFPELLSSQQRLGKKRMGGMANVHGLLSVGTASRARQRPGLLPTYQGAHRGTNGHSIPWRGFALLGVWVVIGPPPEAAFVLKNRFSEVNDKTCLVSTALSLLTDTLLWNLPVRPWLPSFSAVEPDTLTIKGKREDTSAPNT